MRISIAFLLITLTPVFIFSQQGWYPLVSGTTSTLNSIYFPATGTGNFGYAVGGVGKILFTANAGVNWTDQSSPTSNDLNSVFFISPSIGWAAGTAGTIIYTSNGGLNWLQQTTPTTEILYSVHFANQLTGWSTGASGTILVTSNGGVSWTTQNSGSGDYLRSVYFTSPTNGTAVGRNGRIIKTTNGGLNWLDVSPFLTSTLYSVYFALPSVGWAVGFGSLYTINGGNNWSLQPGSGIYFSVYFPTLTTGWRVGYNGVINVTTNSGTSWSAQTSGVANWLFSVYFTSINTGYVAGDNGTILKTTDGGGLFTGIEPISNNIPQGFSLSQNYPNPFNSSTKFKIQISKLSDVKVIIFDVLGQEIATLVDEQLKPGIYEIEWDATDFPSGIYYYTLITNSFSETKRMVLLK